MNITVNEQPKRFWVAYENTKESKWVSCVGHEIKVGDYTFFIALLPGCILRVTEATTGGKIFETKLTFFDLMLRETKEETLAFYRDFVGERLKEIIKRYPDIKDRIKRLKKDNDEKLGDMPLIEDFDETLIVEQISDVLN